MNQAQPIQIFRAGRHRTTSGAVLNFTEADIHAIADAYDVNLHEAPFVIGHPHADAPAYGWVAELGSGNGLQATPSQVDPAFREMVSKGRFKKVSASFYAPGSPANPAPGVYYLRHVGFLGAQPPAVKGLRQVEFAEDDDTVTIEFSEHGHFAFAGLARVLRSLREWLIDSQDTTIADQVVPEFAVNAIEEASRMPQQTNPDQAIPFAETKLSKMLNRLIDAKNEPRAEVIASMATAAGIESGTVSQILRGEIDMPPERRLSGFAKALGVSLDSLKNTLPTDFSESTLTGDDIMTPAEINALAVKLTAQQQALATQATAFAEREANITATEQRLATEDKARRHTQITTQVADLVASGKVLPREQLGMAAFMEQLDASASIEFGEGDDSVKQPTVEFFNKFLDGLDTRIDYAERAPGSAGAPGVESDQVIADKARVHRDKASSEGRNISFAEAVNEVTAERDA